MKFSEAQIKWLRKAKARDISSMFAKKDIDFKDKMEIQKKWLEIHQSNKQSQISEEWFKPETWR